MCVGGGGGMVESLSGDACGGKSALAAAQNRFQKAFAAKTMLLLPRRIALGRRLPRLKRFGGRAESLSESPCHAENALAAS